jgi:hypothetical protein
MYDKKKNERVEKGRKEKNSQGKKKRKENSRAQQEMIN